MQASSVEEYPPMDSLDREILSLLQEDGRMSATELAERVALSLSSCHRRLKALEQTGAIERYRAVISPRAVGLTFEGIVFVTMGRADAETIASFEAAVSALESVVEAQRLFGEPDYMLRVLTRDMASYQQLYDTALAALPGVQRLTSTMVMKRIVSDRKLPLGRVAT
jgi:DNA-binding Lrp family transcriptional regulator